MTDLERKKLIFQTRVWGLIILVSVVGAYIINFVSRGYELSDDPAVWGTFGDYIGGVLNPIVAIANLVLLIIISYQIASGEERRSREELDLQRQVANNQTRHQAFKELVEVLNLLSPKLISKIDAVDEIKEIRLKIWDHFSTIHYLFPNLVEFDFSKFDEQFDRLVLAKEAFDAYRNLPQDFWSDLGTHPIGGDYLRDELRAAMHNVSTSRNELIRLVNNFLRTTI